jgi:hypothetical protein
VAVIHYQHKKNGTHQILMKLKLHQKDTRLIDIITNQVNRVDPTIIQKEVMENRCDNHLKMNNITTQHLTEDIP